MSGSENPIYSPFFGVMGAASAMIFSAMGAAYGTAKSGTGIAAMAVMRPGKYFTYCLPQIRINHKADEAKLPRAYEEKGAYEGQKMSAKGPAKHKIKAIGP